MLRRPALTVLTIIIAALTYVLCGLRPDNALPAALRGLSLGSTVAGVAAKDSDFSDFCLQPPPGLCGEELRKFQEEQDAVGFPLLPFCVCVCLFVAF